MPEDNNKPLIVYKASAGSGKTFTLAVEYIKLLIANPANYRTILAVTFTNKATEEMKLRILSQLYGLWKHLPDSKSYLDKIKKDSNNSLSDSYISEQAGRALTLLLHNYSYFRIETIDSFFQNIFRNLAHELDLTANLRVGLNDKQVEDQAVDQLIEELNSKDNNLRFIMNYIEENIADDKNWNVIDSIKEFGKTIFKDFYKTTSKQLMEKLEKNDFFESFNNELKDIQNQSIAKMKAIGKEFDDILSANGIEINNISNGKNGVAGFFIKLRDGVFDESVVLDKDGKEKARITKARTPEGWCTATLKKSNATLYNTILSVAESSLVNLLERGIKIRKEEYNRYQSAKLARQHIYKLRLLTAIEMKVRSLNTEANRFLLSDTQQMLNSLIKDTDAPFVFEKIGSHLEHIMIDEFQDTSVLQWNNFKTLLLNCMSNSDARNLIVGDVKQSIYRWRSGDWSLLNNIENQFANSDMNLSIINLDTNYRSSANVIRFNNAFFECAIEFECDRLKTINEEYAKSLENAYRDVKQKCNKSNKYGYVRMTLLPKNKDSNEDIENEDDNNQVEMSPYNKAMLDEIGNALKSVIDEEKKVDKKKIKIAILLRDKKYIPTIADYIKKHFDINVVSDEAFKLDASLALNVIVNALHLLTHQDDVVAQSLLVKLYQRILNHNFSMDDSFNNTSNDFIDEVNRKQQLPNGFLDDTEHLMSLPLYELCEEIYLLFNLKDVPNQDAYLCAFYDNLSSFVDNNTSDIDAFVNQWNEEISSKTIMGDEVNGVQIVTIHRSKGLEYDSVILPYCEWKLKNKNDDLIWCKPNEAPFDKLPLLPINNSKKATKGTIFENDFQMESFQNRVDNLNLLYVAFTRAKNNLFIIGQRLDNKNKDDKKQFYDNNMRTALLQAIAEAIYNTLGTDENGEKTDVNISYSEEDNDSPIVLEYGSLYVEKDKEDVVTNMFMQKPEALTVKVESFKNHINFKQSNKSNDFIENSDNNDAEDTTTSDYISIGKVLHNTFSKIRYFADIDKVLKQQTMDGVLPVNDISNKQLSDKINSILNSKPIVADWFSTRWRLIYNECNIIYRKPEDIESSNINNEGIALKYAEERPDRVMICGDEIVIIDYKFGNINNKKYSSQVFGYIDLLSKMGYNKVHGYLWYVLKEKIFDVNEQKYI